MKSDRLLGQIILMSVLLLVYSQSWAADPSKPPAPVDDWQGTNFKTAYSASVTAIRPFDISMHEEMTPSGSVCSETMNAANYRQDIYHAFESYAHFDNCAFEFTYGHIESFLIEADAYFRTAPTLWEDKNSVPQPVLDGMHILGQVLHSIQDFYAHSNYVELMQQINLVPKREQDIPVMMIWTEQGHQKLQELIRDGLVSGRVWWTLPHYCRAQSPTHAQLNKDSPTASAGAVLSIWNRSVGDKKQKNYDIAYNLAIRGTGEFLQWCGERWPQIEKYCGKTLKYIIAPEKRQADLPEPVK